MRTIDQKLPIMIGGSSPSGGRDTRGTILLVEDQGSLRLLATSILTKGGYQVLEAENGQEALERAASYGGKIDLLVTDLVMPFLGGAELVGRLRSSRPGLRVLFATGKAEDEVPLGDRSSLLEKPYTLRALLGHVAKRLATV